MYPAKAGTYYSGGWHLEHGVYPSALASLNDISILLCLRYWQPSTWYFFPVFVIKTTTLLGVCGVSDGVSIASTCFEGVATLGIMDFTATGFDDTTVGADEAIGVLDTTDSAFD